MSDKDAGILFQGTVGELKKALAEAERIMDVALVEVLEEQVMELTQENARLRAVLQDIVDRVDHGPSWVEDRARKALE